MKKMLAILLSAVMVLALLAGCGSKDNDKNKDSDTQGGDASALNVAVFYYDFSDVYISSVRNSMEEQFNAMGIKPSNYDGAGNQAQQTDQINTAISNGANLLIVNIVETSSPDAAQNAVEAAKTAGIPIIFFNREVSDDVVKSYDKCAFVGTDAPEAGHMQGKLVGEYLLANYDAVDLNGDGSISYVMFKGQEGNAEAEARTQYGVEDANELLTAAGYKQEDIKGFADLKKVADDIQARKAELGVDGAFTSAGMDGSSDWRFKTHLANLPIYYEYKADGIGSTDAIKGTYLDNYKQIWDLYITDSTCDPTLLASKTGNDAVAEFVGKKAVFYQNGTWAYSDVKDLGDDNLGMLPIYIGAEGEENQGLCTGSENFWCVNNTSSDEDIQATLDFLYWCVTSETGTSAMADDMGFVIPFKAAKDSTNPLIAIANDYVAAGKTSVDWCFSTMPSEEWKNGVGSALTAYAAGTGDWNAVVTAFVDGWAKEYKLANG